MSNEQWYLFRDRGTQYAGGMIDRKDASRDDLIRLIVAHHETIPRQERVIAAQAKWRDAQCSGKRGDDEAGDAVRHLAAARGASVLRLPRPPHFPSSLN